MRPIIMYRLLLQGVDRSSWVNEKAYTSFSFSSLVAGDTVFVDGGAILIQLFIRIGV